ncbi:MAG: hypothetical protein QM760_05905 [Nibricoccus sp.]
MQWLARMQSGGNLSHLPASSATYQVIHTDRPSAPSTATDKR